MGDVKSIETAVKALSRSQLSEYGPSLRLPHSRAFGDGLFELGPAVGPAQAARSTVA